MNIGYAEAHDLLGVLVQARTSHDGDRYTDLFPEDAEVILDPFCPPLVGHNALRAYLLEAAAVERDFDLAVERHWVSGASVLASWHASWSRIADDAKIRQAGFMALEVGDAGRILRLRYWTVSREHLAG